MSDSALMEKIPGNQAGLYIHIPFCVSKCAYCAFNSFTLGNHNTTEYLQALHDQLKLLSRHPLVAKNIFSSIFIGGGTPTIYSGRQLAGLISAALDSFKFNSQPEITVEGNPDSIKQKSLTVLRQAGVNRLSIGVQSFADKLLVRLSRAHSEVQAENAIKTAREAGFTNINLDLMFGLPGQSYNDWQQTLDTACRYEPEHLAIYELTVEKKTPFGDMAATGKLRLPDDDLVADMAELTRQTLPNAGFNRYEIANFSRPGYECRHNINYWRNGAYLGLGAGAVSCIAGVRISNVNDPVAFNEQIKNGDAGCSEAESLYREKRFRETVIMGLRMIKGVSLADLRERFNMDPRQYYGNIFRKLQKDNLLEIKDDHLRIPAQSLAVANQALAELV